MRLVQLGKIDIEEMGPCKAGRRKRAVNSELLKEAEQFRRSNSFRPSAVKVKSGGAPLYRAEPKKDIRDSCPSRGGAQQSGSAPKRRNTPSG